MRVSYIGITTGFQPVERGSTPLTRSLLRSSSFEVQALQDKLNIKSSQYDLEEEVPFVALREEGLLVIYL